MTPVVPSSGARPALGVALMALAMLSIPLVDGLAKYLSAYYSPLFLSWARYAVACAVVVPIARAVAGPPLFPAERRGSHVLRTLFLVTAMTLYFLAVARIPLATAVSAYFVGPIIAMGLSALVLKERITTRKGASLLLGFVGSLVILRPGVDMDAGVLLALGAGLFFALYLIATRQAAVASDPLKTLVFQCAVGVLLLAPQAGLTWTLPAWQHLPFFLALGVLSVVSHILSISAFRFADASTLSPLVYLELIGAALVGYLAFGDVPSGFTVAGAVLIAGGGLLVLDLRRDRPARAGGVGRSEHP